MSGSLRGPSGEALRRLESQLAEALRPVGSRKAAQVGEELFSLAAVVRGEPRLRRTLTDVSVDTGAKAQLVRAVFGGKADDISVDLLATASGQRWTTPGDLADALEELAVETTVRSADDAGRVADELFAVEQLLTGSPELRNALGDPARSVEDKRALLDSLLGDRVLAATSRLVAQSLSGTHRTVSLAVAAYQRVAAAVQGESVATVRTARPLSEREQERLVNALRRQYDRPVHLNVVVDPGVIGGVRVEVGDDVIDGTVASRLDDARRRLAG